MAKPTKLPEWDQTEVNTVEPDAAHKSEGWLAPAGVPEKPPFQTFNFWQNSVWKWLNEINIKGTLGYDALTDYLADLSYVVGSDGNLYQCGINNGPSSSVVNPVGDVTGTWNDIINVTPVTARGYIDGLILENDTDTDHDIKINIGICRDKTDALPIQLTATMVKQIDVNWAAGTGNGGFPSGLTLLADTWYHFYIIMKADGTVDAGFDTSLIATNLLADATDYLFYRRVGSVLTDGSSNIIQFVQIGDNFLWYDPPKDISTAITTAAGQLFTMSSPLGIKTKLLLNIFGTNATVTWSMYVSSPDVLDELPGASGTTVVGQIGITSDANIHYVYDSGSVHTNTSSQIRARGTSSVGTEITTKGYIDPRGKDI